MRYLPFPSPYGDFKRRVRKKRITRKHRWHRQYAIFAAGQHDRHMRRAEGISQLRTLQVSILVNARDGVA